MRRHLDSIWTVSPVVLEDHAGVVRIAEDVDGADLSGVAGTPTFFVNGRRYQGSFDIDALSEAARVARLRAIYSQIAVLGPAGGGAWWK